MSSDEMSSSRYEGRSPGSARTLIESRRWRSVPPKRSTASDSPTGCDRHVHADLLGHLHDEEVDVLRDPLHGMLVDALEEHRCRLAAADREVEQRVAAGMPEQRLELTRVELDGLRRVAMAVDDGGQDALTAQAADLLAEDLARLCRHDRTSAHGREPLSGWRDLRCVAVRASRRGVAIARPPDLPGPVRMVARRAVAAGRCTIAGLWQPRS